MVLPGLGIDPVEQLDWDVEHGRGGVEHHAHRIDESLGLRVNKVLQEPQALSIQDMAHCCRSKRNSPKGVGR